MQQIERYGVIALVFLLVTIVAISFWGDSKSPGFWSRVTGHDKDKKEQVAKAPDAPATPAAQVADPSLPLGPATPAPLGVQPVANAGAAAQPGANGATQPAPIVLPNTMPPQTQPAAKSADPFLDVHSAAVAQPGAMTPAKTNVPEKSTTNATEYSVQKGDSLARIAAHTLGSEKRVNEIVALNPGLDAKSLQVGQKIKLPAASTAATSVAKTTTPATKVSADAKKPEVKKTAAAPTKHETSGTERTYVVQKGDGLHSIARKELGDDKRWKDIVAMNPGVDTKKLAIGMHLKLPAGEHEHGTMLAAALPAASHADKPFVR